MREFCTMVTANECLGELFFVGDNHVLIKKFPERYIPHYFPGVDVEVFMYWWYKTRTAGKLKATFGKLLQVETSFGADSGKGKGKVTFYSVGLAHLGLVDGVLAQGESSKLCSLLRLRRRAVDVLVLEPIPASKAPVRAVAPPETHVYNAMPVASKAPVRSPLEQMLLVTGARSLALGGDLRHAISGGELGDGAIGGDELGLGARAVPPRLSGGALAAPPHFGGELGRALDGGAHDHDHGRAAFGRGALGGTLNRALGRGAIGGALGRGAPDGRAHDRDHGRGAATAPDGRGAPTGGEHDRDHGCAAFGRGAHDGDHGRAASDDGKKFHNIIGEPILPRSFDVFRFVPPPLHGVSLGNGNAIITKLKANISAHEGASD